MKLSKTCRVTAALIIAALVVLFVGIASSRGFRPDKPAERTQNIQTYVLTSFEKVGNWKVKFSRFTAKIYKPGTGWVEDPVKNQMRIFKGKPWGLDFKHISGEENVLGIKASFDRKGYNYIEIIPKGPIPMEGLVKEIDLWVWGGNFRYRLELQLIDYKDYVHVMDCGWLNYIGWRNIRLKIPGHIPQGEKYIPRLKPLRFKSFKLLAHPGERNDIFYVYFDRMQIQTDVFLSRFDGDKLVKEAPADWMPRHKSLLDRTSK